MTECCLEVTKMMTALTGKRRTERGGAFGKGHVLGSEFTAFKHARLSYREQGGQRARVFPCS